MRNLSRSSDVINIAKKNLHSSRIIILEKSFVFGIIIDTYDDKGEYKKRQSVHR